MPAWRKSRSERGLALRSVKRSPSASPATGSREGHELETKDRCYR